MEIIKKILCGSTYFFNKFKDFKSKDIDELIIVDKGNGFNFVKQVSLEGNCRFYVVKNSDILDYTISNSKVPPMAMCKFLIPEFNKEFNITIEDIKKLSSVADRLDDKHKYLKTIYNSYIENNDFVLTDEQLNAAYEVYKKYRN